MKKWFMDEIPGCPGSMRAICILESAVFFMVIGFVIISALAFLELQLVSDYTGEDLRSFRNDILRIQIIPFTAFSALLGAWFGRNNDQPFFFKRLSKLYYHKTSK